MMPTKKSSKLFFASHRTVWLVFIAITAVFVLFLLPTRTNSPNNQAAQPGNNIALQPPGFVNIAHAQNETNFLYEQAGIAAYVKLDGSIDLSRASDAFKGIPIIEENNYIVGIVSHPLAEEYAGFEEGGDVYVYVHSEGWIVAYLLNHQERAKIIDWMMYDNQNVFQTSLKTAIQSVLSNIGSSNPDIKYYDFAYPNATGLYIAADVEKDSGDTDDFTIIIPEEFVIYNQSFSHASTRVNSQCIYNGTPLSTTDRDMKRHEGLLNLVSGRTEEISIVNYWSGSRSYCGIVIIYQEPGQ